MKNKYYFGRTLSEKLERARLTVDFLYRDFEELKSRGLNEIHLEKCKQLISEISDTGIGKLTIRPQQENSLVLKQITQQTHELLNCLKPLLRINVVEETISKVNLLIRDVKRARVVEFANKLGILTTQLSDEESDYHKDTNLGAWINELNQLKTQYEQALVQRGFVKNNSVQSTFTRNDKTAELVKLVGNLAEFAYHFWKNRNDAKSRDYILSFNYPKQ